MEGDFERLSLSRVVYMVTLCLQPLTFKLVLIMEKVEKIHYVDKAKVLNILQDADEKYKE